MKNKHLLTAVLSVFLSSTSAYAIDCKLAATPSEKAICADPSALAADTALSAAFKTLRGSISSAQSTELMKAQQNWIKQRDNNCSGETGAKLASCLKEASAERTAFLSAKPKSGTAAPKNLLPFFQIEPGGKGKTAIDIQVYKFVKPTSAAQKTFNKEVDRLSGDVQQPGGDDTEVGEFDFSVTMSLDYVSPSLISAYTVTDSYFGGAHPNNQSTTINIDFKKGALAQFKDFLGPAASKKIAAKCTAQVKQQKKDSQGADADIGADAIETLNQTILDVTDDLALWTFTADKAEIQFDSDVVGAHAEGAFSCDIPYAELRPLVKAGFPLP